MRYCFAALLLILLPALPALSAETDKKNNEESTSLERSPSNEWRVTDGQLIRPNDDGTESVVIEKSVLSAYEYGDALYVALGHNGVAVIPLNGKNAGKVSKIIPVSHGRVTALVEMDGELWMKIDATTAVQLSGADAMAGAPTVSPVSGSTLPAAKTDASAVPSDQKTQKDSAGAEVVMAKIKNMFPGKVTLDKGAANGVKAGDIFHVYRTGDISGAGMDGFKGQQVVAVLVVEAVNENSCLANIWRGDRVQSTDKVRKVPMDEDGSLVYPRKFDGVGEISTTIRPIINIGAGGFGTLSDLTVAYYATHFFMDIRMQPLGLGATEGSTVVTNSLLLSGGYNGRAFAVGLGVGLTSTNGNLSEMMQSFSGMDNIDSMGSRGEPEWEQSTKHAFSLAQRVRLGAQDGLNITVNNTLLYYKAGRNDDNPTGFIYAGTTGRITWPLSLRADMFIEGGGGVMGYGFGALGVFTWLRGNGDAGSVGLSVSAGGAGIWSEKTRDYGTYTENHRVSIGGPMFAIGMSYRFGAGLF